MKPRHRLLTRQIQRYIGHEVSIPAELELFIAAVNEAYYQSDIDRSMMERSLELSSQELFNSNSEMRAIFQALPDPYFRLDEEGNILDYKASNHQEGLPPEKNLIGMNFGDLLPAETWGAIHPHVEAAVRLQSLVSLSSPIQFQEEGLLYEARLAPVFKNQVILILRDITDRIHAEHEQKELQRQLLRAQKMEAVGTLAGGVAHDFNNLLMGVQGYASLALRELGISPVANEYLKNIEDLVKKGSGLTKQLLGFAQGGKYEVQTTQLNGLLTSTANMFGRTKKELAISMQLEEQLWTVEADSGQIEQVLMNIFINAWQAMPGGGDLTVQTENVFLKAFEADLRDVLAGQYARISITDTGMGMDEATKERIFEPFFTTKAVGEGTGLGLASAYGIIRNHGGCIDVISNRGKGSTFQIYLPASPQNDIAEQNGKEESVRNGQETILVVDDEQVNLIIFKALLSNIGYQVLEAGSGQEAIAVYTDQKDQIALVIMDMVMPGMSGTKVFEALREINPEVKVILCSGYSLDYEADAVMSIGCHGFIQKPFTLEALSHKIREVLD